MKACFVLAATLCGVHGAALTPVEERASFQLANDSLMVELVAAEPNVVSPVAITWDARGRMFVAEMIDYPLGPGSGQVRLLVDSDGDGVYETSTVFADKLAFPNGVLPWRDGILVTSAPDILFLRDTDGDGRADERRVMLTGFAEGNQQLRVNGLCWGLDGWIYGANGRSDGELRRPGEAKGVSLRGHDFRFKPDTGEFEAIAGRSQFGTTRNDWGHRFLSWNTIAIRHEIIPERYLARNPNIALTEAVKDLAPEGDTGQVFPRTVAPQTFNSESTSHFNALAGLTIYRGDALPSEYYGNAFMGETLRNLVHRRVLEPAGASFIARRVEEGKEFLASSDPWFHPVNFATGPDGALYIADFYRQWVEHPGYVPEKFRDKFPWRTGAEHGRIWRVRPREWKREELPSTDRLQKLPMLSLGARNAWWRDTAMRLMLEDPTKADILGLKKRVPPHGAVNPREQAEALYLLSNLGKLDDDTLRAAFRAKHPRLLETAVRLADGRREFSTSIAALTSTGDPALRLAVALALGSVDREQRAAALAGLASRPDLDHTLAVAIRSSGHEVAGTLIEALPHSSTNDWFFELVSSLAFDTAARQDTGELQRLTEMLLSSEMPGGKHLAIFSGFCRALPKNDEHRRRLLSDRAAGKRFISAARKNVADAKSPLLSKENALETLAALASFETPPSVLSYLSPDGGENLQRAAAQAIGAAVDAELFRQALVGWKTYTLNTRRQLASASTRSPAVTQAMMDVLRRGEISPLELDAGVRNALLRDGGGTNGVPALLGPPQSADRAAVIAKHSEALGLTGDRQRGKDVFEKNCLACHTHAGFSVAGGNIGPNLSAIASRSREALLVDIFDPSRQVNPEYLAYTIELEDHESLTGIVVAENSGSLTLRRANAADETIARSRIQSVRASTLSLMPEGLETAITQQELADLLEYLVGGK